MEKELKAKLLREFANLDEDIVEENTYTLIICDTKNHYKITADEQRTFCGDCDCSPDEILEKVFQVKPTDIKTILANETGNNYT